MEEKIKLENELNLEKALREQIENELQQERSERKVTEEASAKILVEVLEDIKRQNQEIDALRLQLEVEVDLRQNAEAALKKLEEIFDVGSGEEQDADDFVKIKHD